MSLYAHPKHKLTPDEARPALASFDRLAILVTPDLAITHLPMRLNGDALEGHIAKANAHWRAAPCDAVVICPGPEAYVSPTWYPSKHEHQRGVPTWNYTALHVHGRLSVFEDAARLTALVSDLSDVHEQRHGSSWRLNDAPRDYIDRLIAGIVGVTVTIASIEGKAKLSQDKSAADHDGVRTALLASNDPRDRAVGELMTQSQA